ncbi:MAG TPA: hypothetical protein VGG54_25175 [Trebonia sp.]
MKLASKGMNVVGLDICADIPSMDYVCGGQVRPLLAVALAGEAGSRRAAA